MSARRRVSIGTGENPALARIRARGYSAKYSGLPGNGLIELALVLDSGARSLAPADWARVE
jgi:hypothetical protein